MVDNKHWEVAKQLSLVEWIFTSVNAIINDDIWSRMTPETQKIMRGTWKEVGAEISQKEWARQPAYVELFRKNGVTVVKPDAAPFREATRNVWREFAPKVWGEGVYEKVQAVR